MKILITRHTEYSLDKTVTDMDHVSDLILHGLVMLGHEVTDAPKIYTVYKSFGQPGTLAPNGLVHRDLFGMGFTLCNTVPDETHIDRTDIESRIRNHYFDLVILSRADFSSPYEELILEHYPPTQVIILDGKDSINFGDAYTRDTLFLIERGTYFKRELVYHHPRVFPISCSFPKDKIIHPSGIAKTQTWSIATPKCPDVTPDTYEFNNELEYYRGYARSYLGMSNRKYEWWEYERHYEIMASGCVPVIPQIANCPVSSLCTMPKEQLLAVNQFITDHGADWFTHGTGLEIYQVLQEQIFNHFLEHCTTEAVAQYMLDTHAKLCNK